MTRTVKCEVGDCKWTQETREPYWMKKCHDHFLKNHRNYLSQLGFQDSVGCSPWIQDLHTYLGQCSAPGCAHVFGSSLCGDKDKVKILIGKVVMGTGTAWWGMGAPRAEDMSRLGAFNLECSLSHECLF